MHYDFPQSLTLLKASAGSGKTYHLALEFIALALSDQDRFKHILAITFTNKATREMKERVLLFLEKVSKNSDPELTRQLVLKTKLSENEITSKAGLILKNILHHYSHFSIKTIDSFNQKILRSFAREIGLLGNFNLELDTQKVLDYAVDAVIEQSGDKKEVRQWILDFTKDKITEGLSWDVSKDLKNLANELYNEKFKILETIDPNIISSTPTLGDFIGDLKKVRNRFENDMKIIGKNAESIFKKHQFTPSDFFQGSRGVYSYFINIQKSPDKYEPNSYVIKGLNSAEEWCANKSTNKELIIEVVNNDLMVLLHQSQELMTNHFREYISAISILKNIYALGLFAEIKKAIDQYKNDNDTFLLNDTNIFIRGIIRNNETPFIYEKTGGWYYHFLIDEFQDTSQLQWENLKPLLSNSMDESNKNLVVGDPKQSIYRWRGGDWELIEKVVTNSFSEEHLSIQNLDTNWRSTKEVLEFNNAIFQVLPGIFSRTFAAEAPEGLGQFSEDFTTIFQNARQLIPQKNIKKTGYVEINALDKDNGKSNNLVKLKSQIESLQDAGYALKDIAILTRTKSEGVEVVQYLNELNRQKSTYQYRIISNESLLIKNYPAIRLIVHSLIFIKDPKNELNLVNVAIEYFNEKSNPLLLSGFLGKTTLREQIEKLFPLSFLSEIEKYQRFGLMECVSAFIKVFNLVEKIENAAYLMGFQDIVQNYVSENGNDVYTFLEWWEENKEKQALQNPENIDAIRIMTIHKAKGLEFEAVIIPFFNWGIDHSGRNNVFLWCINENQKYNQQSIVPLKYQSKLAQSDFAEAYFDEKHRAFIDNLNLCYVAFTRAKRALFINAEKISGKNGSNKNVSALLQQALEKEDFLPGLIKSDESFSYGQLEKFNDISPPVEIASEKFILNPWQQKTKLKRRGRELFEKSGGERIERINYGIIVHEILAQIKSKSEVPRLLMQYKLQGIIANEEIDLLIDQLDGVFSNPEVARWFDGNWDVKSERTILSPDSEEMRPDRVLINGKDAIIIDFKTGVELPGHTNQLVKYRNKLMEMGFTSVEAFVLYIQNNKVKQIA